MTDLSFHRILATARAGEAWGCARIYEDLKQPVLGYVAWAFTTAYRRVLTGTG